MLSEESAQAFNIVISQIQGLFWVQILDNSMSGCGWLGVRALVLASSGLLINHHFVFSVF